MGVGLFCNLLLMEQIQCDDMPILQSTRPGWVLGSECNPINVRGKVISCLSINSSTEDNLTRF